MNNVSTFCVALYQLPLPLDSSRFKSSLTRRAISDSIPFKNDRLLTNVSRHLNNDLAPSHPFFLGKQLTFHILLNAFYDRGNLRELITVKRSFGSKVPNILDEKFLTCCTGPGQMESWHNKTLRSLVRAGGGLTTSPLNV